MCLQGDDNGEPSRDCTIPSNEILLSIHTLLGGKTVSHFSILSFHSSYYSMTTMKIIRGIQTKQRTRPNRSPLTKKSYRLRAPLCPSQQLPPWEKHRWNWLSSDCSIRPSLLVANIACNLWTFLLLYGQHLNWLFLLFSLCRNISQSERHVTNVVHLFFASWKKSAWSCSHDESLDRYPTDRMTRKAEQKKICMGWHIFFQLSCLLYEKISVQCQS